MEYITTTQLRTKTKWLVDGLRKGRSFLLIHRSEIMGTIVPVSPKHKLPNINKLEIVKNIK